MSLIDSHTLNVSPYSPYNCSFTTIPQGITSETYSQFESYTPLVTSCLLQFKKAFCSQSLAKEVETTFWIDKCIAMQTLEKKGALEPDFIRNEFKFIFEQFGVEKGALYMLATRYFYKDKEKLETLLKTGQFKDLNNLVKLKIALHEDSVEKATLLREKIQGREEELGAALEFYNYFSSKCSLDQLKPWVEFLEERQVGEFLKDLISRLSSKCMFLKKYDEVLGVLELKNEKGELYFNQKDLRDTYNTLSFYLLSMNGNSFRLSDEEIKQIFVKSLSFFKKIRSDEGQLIFAKNYIDFCVKYNLKPKAIEIAEMIENDPNRIEAFWYVYRAFKGVSHVSL